MAILPLALNSYGTDDINPFGVIVKSVRTAPGVWTVQEIFYTPTIGSNAHTCTASGFLQSQFDKLGVVTSNQFDVPEEQIFLGNGPPDTPVSVGPVDTANIGYTRLGYWNVSHGAYWHANKWNLILFKQDFNTGEFGYAAVSSPDGQQPWTEEDSLMFSLSNWSESSKTIALRWDGASDTIDIWTLYPITDATNVAPYCLYTYNMATGVFSAPGVLFDAWDDGHLELFASTPRANPAQLTNSNGIRRFSNGDIGVFYQATVGGRRQLYYRLFSGGVWGSEIIVAPSADDASFGVVVLDPDDEDSLHLLNYREVTDPFTLAAVDYRIVTHAGSVTASLGTFRAGDLGVSIIYNGDLIVGSENQDPGSPTPLGNCAYVAPLSTGGPVTFVQEVIPVPPGIDPETASCTYLIFAPTTGTTLTMVKVVVGGTASATDWDLEVDTSPPISGAGGFGPIDIDPGTYQVSESAGPSGYTSSGPVLSGDGSLVGDMLTVADGDNAVITFTNSAASVTFEKTVIGGTAVPTDFTLQFWQSGALIALAAVGHTVTLNPGDYELIELGPSGYTTSYTLTGTGGSLTGNTLTVSNGDDVTVTATNTQGGQPEASCGMGAGGIPVGSSPTGCFELLRVVATFRPARHLPVRGSNR